MLTELFDRIYDLSRKSFEPKQVNETPQELTYLMPDGTTVVVAKRIPQPKHTTRLTFASFLQSLTPDHVVYVSPRMIYATPGLDEWVTLELTHTTALKWLTTRLVAHNHYYSHKKFVRELRITLSSAIDADLIKQLESLDYSQTKSGTSKIGRQDESMGASITSQVRTGEEDLPQTTVIHAHITNEYALRQAFPVFIDINHDEVEPRFRFAELEDCLHNRCMELLVIMAEDIKKSSQASEVYIGYPDLENTDNL